MSTIQVGGWRKGDDGTFKVFLKGAELRLRLYPMLVTACMQSLQVHIAKLVEVTFIHLSTHVNQN